MTKGRDNMLVAHFKRIFSFCRVSLPLRLADGKPVEGWLPHPLPTVHAPRLSPAPQTSSNLLNLATQPGFTNCPTRLPNVAKQEEGGPGQAALLPLSPLLSLPGEERPLVALALQHHLARNLISWCQFTSQAKINRSLLRFPTSLLPPCIVTGQEGKRGSSAHATVIKLPSTFPEIFYFISIKDITLRQKYIASDSIKNASLSRKIGFVFPKNIQKLPSSLPSVPFIQRKLYFFS